MIGARSWPVWLVWLILVGASITGFLLTEGATSARVATTAAILLAAVKIHLVFGQYMEIRWHHRPLRQMLAGWLVVVTIILLIGCWAA